MTSLRDPRFEKALEAAPDAHLRPDARTRQAVLQAAAAAVQPQSVRQPVAWWRRWWSGPAEGGAGRMPWNAAFATVLLAGFVTLLWQGQPVPDARLDDAPVDKAARQSTPQVQSAPSGTPAARPATPAKAAADSAAHAKPSERAPRQEPAPAAVPAPAIAQERSSEAATGAVAQSAPPAPATREVQPPPPTTQPSMSTAAPAPPAPAPDQRADAAVAPAQPSARAQASAALPALSAPPRAAAPGLAAGGALGRAAPVAVPDSAALQGWTELRIAQGGQTLRIARADATALAAQVRRVAPTSGAGALPGTSSLRIAFAQGDEVLAELELGEPPWVRWTLLRAGFAGQWTAQADRGQLQTLQLELQRLGFTAR